jgi:hypothetical protein
MSMISGTMPDKKNINIVKIIRTVHRIGEYPSSSSASPVISAWASKPTLKLEVPSSKPTVNIPSTSPTSPRPGFLEPLSPAAASLLQTNIDLHTKERVAEYWNWQMEQPGFWEEKIEHLEKRREKYNVKSGWSAKDVAAADAIDQELKYCFKELQQLKEDEEDYY